MSGKLGLQNFVKGHHDQEIQKIAARREEVYDCKAARNRAAREKRKS